MVKTNGFLLDTHIFIWWMEKNNRLPQKLFDLINNPHDQIFLSVASVWEIVIKKAKNKLKVPKDVEHGVRSSGFSLLSITIQHVLELEKLPHYHKDPFDRILLSQAQVENLTLISSDEKMWKYKSPLLKVKKSLVYNRLRD